MSKKDPLKTLDARILTQIQYPSHPKGKTRKAQMKRVRHEVMGCEACPLQEINGTLPVPFRVEPDVRPSFVVLMEGPGPDDQRTGKAASGPVGRQVRALLKEAGISPYDAMYVNAVACMPTNNGKTYRQAKKPEIHACHGNLMRQLEVAFTPYVLMVGGHVFDIFRSDLTVADNHGRVFIWNDSYVVMAIEHPEIPSHHPKIVKDLKRWRKVVTGDDDPLKWLGDTCVKCGGHAAMMDRDGVGYCERDMWKHGNQWRVNRERFDETVVDQLHIF